MWTSAHELVFVRARARRVSPCAGRRLVHMTAVSGGLLSCLGCELQQEPAVLLVLLLSCTKILLCQRCLSDAVLVIRIRHAPRL